MASAASAVFVARKHDTLETCIEDSQQLVQAIMGEIDAEFLATLHVNSKKYVKYEALRNAIGFMHDTRHNLYNKLAHEHGHAPPDTDSSLELCNAYHEVLSRVHAKLSDISKLIRFLDSKSIVTDNETDVYYQTLFWIYDNKFAECEKDQIARLSKSKDKSKGGPGPGGNKRSHKKRSPKKRRSHKKRSH